MRIWCRASLPRGRFLVHKQKSEGHKESEVPHMSNFNKLIDRFDRFFLYHLGKIVRPFGKPVRKFYTDIVYGILKGQSIILSDVAHSLNERTLPKKTIERLSRFLDRDHDLAFRERLLAFAISLMPKDGLKVFSVDDTDVAKIYGKRFEAMGKVRDASSPKGSIENGYRVSCVTALTAAAKHPMPVFDVFHSETQPGFKSVNKHTFDGLEFICSHLKEREGVFIFDRGYDDYKVINFVRDHRQFFVIRMTKNRKIAVKGRKVGLIDEGKRKKGKIVMPVVYKGKRYSAKVSHLKVRLLDGRSYFAVYCYLGDGSEPMTLLTNREIRSKEDVIAVVMNYASRWKIEEQFRFKKNGFNFEDFRVRSLNRINNLAMCLDTAVTLMSALIEGNSELYQYLISVSKHLKGDRAYIKFYQLLSGIKTLLGHKEMGIRSKEKIEHRPKQVQLTLF